MNLGGEIRVGKRVRGESKAAKTSRNVEDDGESERRTFGGSIESWE